MPITIKELFPSDPISEALEKINFNFDQLILAGGGPPGPSGPLGPQGVPGPQGDRGDHWFVGPSATGQTADHDGGSLEIADHFLDSNGDVYEYFSASGSTGWTATNVNLTGPTGGSGPTGGNVDFGVYAGKTGNAQSTDGFYPDSSNQTPTSETDFLIPTQMYKNSIFVGDVGWAYNYLQNFGGIGGTGHLIVQDEVPKLSIIQKNINTDGLNGLMIGGYGAIPGSTSGSGVEGGVGSTTSAKDFIYMGIGKPYVGFVGTPIYQREFRIKSFTQNIRIEAGGNGANDSTTAKIELASAGLSWIQNNNGQRFLSNTAFTQNILTIPDGTITGFNDEAFRYIELNSKPGNNTFPVGATDSDNTYGAIILQNAAGADASGFNINTHGFGNVIIGPTFSDSDSIGVKTQQGLAIVRDISGSTGNNDASIRFFHEDKLNTSENSTILGGIRAGRQEFTDTVLATSGEVSYIQIGAGSPKDLGPTATSATIDGGKVGINNHPGWSNDTLNRSKPWFPVHMNLTSYSDDSYPTSPYEGATGTTGIDRWIFGIDSTSSGSGDIGPGGDLASSGLGISYSNEHDNISEVGYPTRSLIVQSYYTTPAASGTAYNGNLNPHVYFQIGGGNSGNMGLGLHPHLDDGTDKTALAYNKLSIDGGLTIGSVEEGYHFDNSVRQSQGILVEGRIAQGSSANQFLTSTYNPAGVTSLISNQIGISSVKSIWGHSFTSKNDVYNDIPQFSFSDLRTGLSQDTDGEANFVVPTDGTFDPSIGPTAGFTKVGKFSRISNQGYNYNTFKPALVATKAFVQSTPTDGSFQGREWIYTLQDLADNGFAISGIYNNGAFNIPYKKVFFSIPTKTSTTIIDLYAAATFGHFSNASGTPWVTGSSVGPIFLTGKKTNGTYTPLLDDQFRFILEPGSYNGQVLNLIVRNVADENARMHSQSSVGGAPFQDLARLHPDQPLRETRNPLTSATVTSSGAFNGTLYDDIVMAKDYASTSASLMQMDGIIMPGLQIQVISYLGHSLVLG